jgi:hypothetical protein
MHEYIGQKQEEHAARMTAMLLHTGKTHTHEACITDQYDEQQRDTTKLAN